MAKLETEIQIKVDDSDLKEIVRLRCFNQDCIHNMVWKGLSCCNLKEIVIGKDGKCSDTKNFTEEYKKNKQNAIHGKVLV